MENFRYAVIIDARDVVYSDDLFVLDIMNQQFQNIGFMDRTEYEAKITDIMKNKNLSPGVGIIKDRFNQFKFTNILDELSDQYELARKFLRTKTKRLMFEEILKDIKLKYPTLIENTYVSFRNPNLFGITDTPNMFMLFDNSIYDMKSKILSIFHDKKDDVNKILLDRNNLCKFFKSGISPSSDVGVKFVIITSDENIEDFIRETCNDLPEDFKDYLNCEAILLDHTNRSVERFNKIKNDENHMTYGVFELWNPNLLTSILKSAGKINK